MQSEKPDLTCTWHDIGAQTRGGRGGAWHQVQHYLHGCLQFALEGEVDEVGLEAQPVVDGVDVSRQPHEGPPLGHAE